VVTYLPREQKAMISNSSTKKTKTKQTNKNNQNNNNKKLIQVNTRRKAFKNC
jgi:hypothetical protein